jgi:predicted CoA-substrate-specific enzyme activase
VFAKTDIIHWSNAGKPQADIIAGIVKGLVKTYVTDLVKDTPLPQGDAVLIGGGALNPMLLTFFNEYISSLRIPAHATSLQAYGAALLSQRKQVCNRVTPEEIDAIGEKEIPSHTNKLVLETSTVAGKGGAGGNESDPKAGAGTSGEKTVKPVEAYLGIDIGSTTTKCALLSFHGEEFSVIHKEYIKTEGRPLDAVKTLLKTMEQRFGAEIRIRGVTTTGSGRYPAGMFIGADFIINEITSHALAAVRYAPWVDTVFELGGQDSKYISIKDGFPVDFNMNKICSAGTGSFLEEMAEKLKVNIEGEFQEKSLAAEHPIALGDRCTVFMESGVSSAIQQGAKLEDICAGLSLAVVHNYINRVVENRKIGEHIMFLGGPSQNLGVVAAFEQVTGATITVPRHSEVFGAIGAALYAYNKMSEQESSFRGLGIHRESLRYREATCKNPHCSNECKLQVYTIPRDGSTPSDRRPPESAEPAQTTAADPEPVDKTHRASESSNPESTAPGASPEKITLIFGDRCGKYEPGPPGVSRAPNFFTVREHLFKQALTDSVTSTTRVILPAHLYMHQLGPLFHHFFNALGIQPVWQFETTEEMIDIGTRTTPANFCFSKIVSTGHIGHALQSLEHDRNSFLWLPVPIDMPQREPGEPAMFCPWTQASYYTLRYPFDLERNPRILHPVLHLKEPLDTIAEELYAELGEKLNLTFKVIQQALIEGFEQQRLFEASVEKAWEEEVEPCLEEYLAIVVIGRPYMLYDEKLNLRIGEEIARLGSAAVPMDLLPLRGSTVLGQYNNMYWGQGAEILRAIQYCGEHPRLFPAVISNFGCGPDSFLSKYIEEEMEQYSRKPLLEIELDAHSARAGMVTRLEAFGDVINSYYRLMKGQHQWQFQNTNSR